MSDCDVVNNCILEAVDCALEAKAAAGVDLAQVSILTRTWQGEYPGRGDASDVVVPIVPNPSVVQFNHDLRLKEGGRSREGDILVKSISKLRYLERVIDGSSTSTSVEVFYVINDKLYNVISIEEKIGTWEVLCRRLSDQARY
jgi:hypothetical protein